MLWFVNQTFLESNQCICLLDVSGTDSRLMAAWMLGMGFVFGQLVAFRLSCPFGGCSRAIITKDIEGDNNFPPVVRNG